jgi:hypothetical protein
MKTSEKDTDCARNETNADDTEKHLHQWLFDPHEYLHKERDAGYEHREGNQNVCIQHANPNLIV